MTNEDYLQWKPLIKKVAWKYRNNRYKIELEDLEQIGAMGLMYAFEHYEDDRGASLKTFIYECVERKIFREFKNMERIKRQADYKATSLDVPINSNDGSDMFLSEIIADDSINIEDDIVDKLVIKAYKEEIETCLSGREKEVVQKVLFENKGYTELANEYGISRGRIRTLQNNGFRHLKHKSKMIREKWLEIQEDRLEANLLSQYNDPERIYFSIQTSKKLLKKYKKEIDILNFIEELFDSLSFDYKMKEYANFILSLDIFDKRKLELFNKRKINKLTQDELLKQGYGYIEILDIENTIKKAILINKEQVYEKWLDYTYKNTIKGCT